MRRHRRSKKSHQKPPQTPVQRELHRILDDLNAFGFLEDARNRTPPEMLCFGPKDIYGPTWSGVVIWLRPAGYHNYQTLLLLGVWAATAIDEAQILVGRRTLPFTAPFYNPEAYFHTIRRTFDIYYDGNTEPPADQDRLHEVVYDPSQRLAIRQDIEIALEQFMASNSPK